MENKIAIKGKTSIICKQLDEMDKVADVFSLISKKGPREFLEGVQKRNLKAYLEDSKERQLQIQADITNMNNCHEENMPNFELQRDRIKVQSTIIEKKLDNDKEVRLREIEADREIKLEELELKKYFIDSYKSCIEKIVETTSQMHKDDLEFYKEQERHFLDFYKPQIERIQNEISKLEDIRNKAFDDNNQEIFVMLQQQISECTVKIDKINNRFNELQTVYTALSQNRRELSIPKIELPM